MTLFQFLFLNGGMAVYFGLVLPTWRPVLWMFLVGAGSLVFVFTPQPIPAVGDVEGIKAALRRHTAVVGIHAGAHGSAGILLFDQSSFAQSQILLAAIMLGMLVAFIEFVSRYRLALQLATVLIVLPTVIMMIWFMRGSLVIMGVLLAFGLPMMLVLVGRRCDIFESIIQSRMDESRLRQTAQDALAQARIAQQDKLRFFAAANHDLRQPVMAIGVYGELLRRQLDDARAQTAGDPPDLQSLRPHVESLQEAQRGLDRLVGQLLDIDQLESDETPLRLGPVKLLPLLSRQIQLHQGAAVRDGARIVLRCPPQAVARSHALQLERIVSNLLDNAVKFTPEGTILLASRRRGSRWRIEVRDSGIGIPPEARELVFSDFEQLANRERDQKRGHGLGLAIVKRVAAQLGTRIDLRTAPGRGSVFAFELPADVDKAELPSASGNVNAMAHQFGTQPPLRVLLVEDDQSLAGSILALLASDGMTARAVNNADDALRAARLDDFDIFICDIRLPGQMDGVALARALEQGQPGRPIVLMSADLGSFPMSEDINGRWTTLRKPVAPQVLIEAIRRVSEQK